ncbi:MAG: YeeE/YedE family protein [Gammaproteobacteria bacterium]|nr:YeeE/YedE family protein [Gammaproteobacteria bacterium]
MDFLEQFSSAEITLGLGLLTGLVFGAFAQQSRFCLRAATVEFWRGKAGDRFSIWLFTFATALLLTQLLIYFQLLERTSVRQLSTVGSMSGAIIGGSLFGIGMIMARGCASRLLVLSATGNLRALVAGLVVTVVSQAALRGVLSPAREEISTWWTVQSSTRDLANYLPDAVPILMALALLVAAVLLARKHGVKQWHKLGAVMVGAAVAMGWGLTAWHASFSFDIVPVKSVSFTGPAADTLMGLINMPTIPLSFDIGIVSGVFAGSFFAAWLSGEFKIQSFNEQTGLSRYLIGAVLMGFGGMLAGGCAVGAGVSGGAVMASTAWIALLSMWISAGLTDRVLDYRPESASTAVPQAAR